MTLVGGAVIVLGMRFGALAAALLAAMLLTYAFTVNAEEEILAPPPRVLIISLPLGSTSHEAVTNQLAEEMERIGIQPVLAEELEIELEPERVTEIAGLRDEAEQHELALELDLAAEKRAELVASLEQDVATVAQPSVLADALARLAATEREAENTPEAIRLWRFAPTSASTAPLLRALGKPSRKR